MAVSRYQKFTTQTIKRSIIKNAPYNPRIIGEKEAKALRKSIKTHGLVDTLIFNLRTDNLVGGHQRLTQLDSLEKYNSDTRENDYELTVSCIDVDLQQEKEINIVLNNNSMQGEFDTTLLKDLLNDVNLDNTGFTDYDLSIIGVEEDLSIIGVEEDLSIIGVEEDLSIIGENYIVVTFDSVESKESFLESLEHEKNDRYIKGEILAKYCSKNKQTE